MRLALFGAVVAAALGLFDSTPAFAQKRDQIYGQTCRQLFYSCFRICARHRGERNWAFCEADCNSGRRTCRITGIWKSRNATIRPMRR